MRESQTFRIFNLTYSSEEFATEMGRYEPILNSNETAAPTLRVAMVRREFNRANSVRVKATYFNISGTVPLRHNTAVNGLLTLHRFLRSIEL